MFGKPDATNEEIYIAAEKANCLQFIEANDEVKDLPVDEQIVAVLDKLGQYKFQETLRAKLNELEEKETALLCDCLKYSDVDIFNCIEKDTLRFIDIVQKQAKQPSARWDDLVYYFEWTFEAEKIKADVNL
jgi:hypothetical protein